MPWIEIFCAQVGVSVMAFGAGTTATQVVCEYRLSLSTYTVTGSDSVICSKFSTQNYRVLFQIRPRYAILLPDDTETNLMSELLKGGGEVLKA